MNEESAKKIVKGSCTADLFDEYQLKVANIVSDAGDELLEPIFKQHPQLRP